MGAPKHGFFFVVVLLFSLIAPNSLALTPIPPRQLITSNESCLSDLDCASDRYCKGRPSRAKVTGELPDRFFFSDRLALASVCVPRLSKGSQCTQDSDVECEEGTFCGYLGGLKHRPPTCVRQFSRGDDCSQAIGGKLCKGNLECVNGRTCRLQTAGLEGDRCQSGPCQVQNGFYCRTTANRCTARKSIGERCGLEPDNFECDGFCVRSVEPHVQPGVCQPLQKAGQKCNDDDQCITVPRSLRSGRTPDLLCNRPSSLIGVCVPEADLIKRLGDSCNPLSDKCDSRRGLSCADVDDKHVCVQNSTSPDPSQHFCTPNSPLSSCPPDSDGNPRECRRALSRITKRYEGMFACRHRRETVPLGAVCSEEEFAVCEAGSVCRRAPGVGRAPGRYPPPPLRTCMKVVPVGANCTDQFRFACAKGSYCVHGACRRVDKPPNFPTKYAPLYGDCSKLSCAPSLSCTPDFGGRKSCKLPVKEVGAWQSCSTSAQFQMKCKKGLHCSLDFASVGAKVCRPKRGVGGICHGDESCRGHLKCDPSHRELGFHRRCFDPSRSLKIGDSCNPQAAPNSRGCVAEIEKDPSGKHIIDIFPLLCLPKGDSHACQRPAALFELCSAKDNTACAAEGVVCSKFNVCVPASQL